MKRENMSIQNESMLESEENQKQSSDSKRKTSSSAGFTLIELLPPAAVIILLGLLLPAVQKVRDNPPPPQAAIRVERIKQIDANQNLENSTAENKGLKQSDLSLSLKPGLQIVNIKSLDSYLMN